MLDWLKKLFKTHNIPEPVLSVPVSDNKLEAIAPEVQTPQSVETSVEPLVVQDFVSAEKPVKSVTKKARVTTSKSKPPSGNKRKNGSSKKIIT